MAGETAFIWGMKAILEKNSWGIGVHMGDESHLGGK